MARILAWADHAFPRIGGVELMVKQLLPALAARGHAVELLASRADGLEAEDRQDGIPVHRLDLPEGDPAAALDRLATGIARARSVSEAFQPDVMLLMQPVAMLAYYFALPSPHGVPSVYALRSGYDWVLDSEGMAARAMAGSDLVVSCSATLLQAARASVPAIAGKSITILSALPEPRIDPAPLPWNPPRIACVGQLLPHKGFDLALRAFSAVVDSESTLTGSIHLTIAGDGPVRAELAALAVSLGIRDRVTFTGWIEPAAVPAVLNDASVVLMPSRVEGLPQVAIQAAQMGRPVIGSCAGGLPEVIVDGLTGLLVPVGDETALASALRALLEDRARAEEMGTAARARAWHFAWPEYVERFERAVLSVRR